MPRLTLTPRLRQRLTPFGILSYAFVGLGVIGLAAPLIGASKMGWEQVLADLASDPTLVLTVVGGYLALLVLQSLPGLVARRRIVLHADRLEVTTGRRTDVYPLGDLTGASPEHHILAGVTWLVLRFRGGRTTRISGWLWGNQLHTLMRRLESEGH